MKITALRLYNVKRFAGRGVAIEDIGDGVNVLCAANEYGKSTSFEALHALFFQAHTGTPEAVRQLRPYSGGSPFIEADIETTQGRYRLAKQFYGGKRASVTDLAGRRLVAQADEAEAFIAGLIRGGTAGPAGLLWVRQGITGIEKRSKAEEEGEKRVRESLLSSVQGEVEALTGGRRMAEIIEACNEELQRLVTPTMRPKSGGRYEAALDERTRLTELERRLRTEVEAMREALDRRGAAMKRLRELEAPDERAARHAAIERAEAALDVARKHGAALEIAQAQAALARNHFDGAQSELTAFRGAMAQAASLDERAGAARQQRDDARARREAATAEIGRARARVEAAETEERETRDLLARLDAALAARSAAERLAQVRARLEAAEALRARIEAGEADLAMLILPAAAVAQLEKLEIDLVGLRAAQNATLPTLRIDYGDGAAGRVTLDGTPLAAGAEHTFTDTARLEIAGIGTLTLRSNRVPDADKALRTARDGRQTLLAALGVETLAHAHRRQAAARDTSAALDLDRQRLHHLAPEGLAPLREEAARLAALGAGDLELKGDPDQVRRHLAAASSRVGETRNGVREAEPLRVRADEGVLAAETACATLAADLARLDATLGPFEERAARDQLLADAHAAQQAVCQQAEAHASGLRACAPDLAGAEAALRRARSVVDAAGKEAAQLNMTVADLNGQIRTRSDDAVEEAWRETAEALAAAADRVGRFETEIAVLDRLRKALQASRSAARDLYLTPVMAELRPLLGLLFDDISIVFDETTLLPQTVRRNGQDEDVERLSGGMREQLSILTRLAFARLLAQDGRPAPVILDDALVYSDDDRIERMFDALHRQSRGQQILVFSCRQRAFARLGGNVLHMSDWTPDHL